MKRRPVYDHSWQALLRPGDAGTFFSLHPKPVFDVDAADFHPANAWWMAEMSRLIYRDDEPPDLAGKCSRGDILSCVNLSESVFASHQNAQWALNLAAARQPFAVLVFRGTSGFENWLANLKVVQSPWEGGGQVHTGFKNVFQEIRDEVEAAICGVSLPLYYTGHSLGGALALLAASLWPPRAVYTFGAPRVGDTVFRKKLAAIPIFRVANRGDIVTGVPPSRIPFEFRHAGKLISCRVAHYLSPGTISNEQEPPALFHGASMLRNALLSRPPRFMSEHAPINYTVSMARRLCLSGIDLTL